MKKLLLAAVLWGSCASAQDLSAWKLANPDSVKPAEPQPTSTDDTSIRFVATDASLKPGENPRFIAAGAAVYIAPMKGFEVYLAAAMEKKHVNLLVVADPDRAEYVITGASDQTKPGWARWLVTGNAHTDDAATVEMVSKRSSAVVFAYSVNKKYTLHGQQTAAEACAKHLEARIEGRE